MSAPAIHEPIAERVLDPGVTVAVESILARAALTIPEHSRRAIDRAVAGDPLRDVETVVIEDVLDAPRGSLTCPGTTAVLASQLGAAFLQHLPTRLRELCSPEAQTRRACPDLHEALVAFAGPVRFARLREALLPLRIAAVLWGEIPWGEYDGPFAAVQALHRQLFGGFGGTFNLDAGVRAALNGGGRPDVGLLRPALGADHVVGDAEVFTATAAAAWPMWAASTGRRAVLIPAQCREFQMTGG